MFNNTQADIMRKYISLITTVFLIAMSVNAYANSEKTIRIPQFSNEEVSVWKTIIYPNKHRVLKMHRHEHNRILIALTSGTLKIINNKGKVDYLTLEKDHVYYLKKNIPGEFHLDENTGQYPIKVLVIELKK